MYLLALSGDEASVFEQREALSKVAGAELAIILAERATKVGRARFTAETLLELQRELRVTEHLLSQLAYFKGQDAGPEAHQVCLIVASEVSAKIFWCLSLTAHQRKQAWRQPDCTATSWRNLRCRAHTWLYA